MSDVHVKAVPTEYRGIPFRSRLEAKYARALELMGVAYKYEPEVFDLGDGISYCPDFYLPESGIYLEVKGKADRYDVEKVKRFSKERRLIVGFDDRLIALNFPGKVTRSGDPTTEEFGEMPAVLGKVALRRKGKGIDTEWVVESGDDVWSGDKVQYLVRCPECGTVQFLDNCGLWRCQSCGFYQGDYILGFQVFGYDGERILLDLVNELDVAPYKRNSVRACINCAHSIPDGGYGWISVCGEGVRKAAYLDDIIGIVGCGLFETAR